MSKLLIHCSICHRNLFEAKDVFIYSVVDDPSESNPPEVDVVCGGCHYSVTREYLENTIKKLREELRDLRREKDRTDDELLDTLIALKNCERVNKIPIKKLLRTR